MRCVKESGQPRRAGKEAVLPRRHPPFSPGTADVSEPTQASIGSPRATARLAPGADLTAPGRRWQRSVNGPQRLSCAPRSQAPETPLGPVQGQVCPGQRRLCLQGRRGRGMPVPRPPLPSTWVEGEPLPRRAGVSRGRERPREKQHRELPRQTQKS